MAMIEKDINVDKLSKLLGISKSSVYRKINGESAFTMPEAKKIVQILGVKQSIFFT